ncbi:MAG: RnfABCDGE type electron transport complex subunit D [Bacteroidaceae bacterium]|jgi:electron transport complex protein RnfD|nr:RnfABCDGE type electron transport complex subunit D [Bacteroidaceae bacterium]
MNKLVVSLSPHVHSGDSVAKNMYWVLAALVPALICSFIGFGVGAIITTAISVVSCVFFEWAITKFIMKSDKCTICDGSAVLTGVLLAFNMPSNIAPWIVVIGAFFAIGVVKMTFGGLGCNLFNPALAARAFLLISFPVQMTTWPVVGQSFNTYLDAETAATPLALMSQAFKGDTTALSQLPSAWDMLIGNTGGCLGEVCALAMILGLVILLVKKVITWHIPVSIIATVFVLSGLFNLVDPIRFANPVAEILSGGLMLGAIFMATDYVTSPMSKKGQLVYGVAIGALTVIIRTFGAYPEGMSFAILIMNAFTPIINQYCKPKRFGEVPAKK